MALHAAVRRLGRTKYGWGTCCRAFAHQTSSTATEVAGIPMEVYGPDNKERVIVTKNLPGKRWKELLVASGCRVEVCQSKDTILSNATIKKLLGAGKTAGVLGQLTEDWGDELFSALREAGGKVYSNYAVGYNNVDVEAATKNGIAVGNTPGVLTETTAELAAALTLAGARRVVEGDKFMRAHQYKGWLPDLFVGNLLQRKTLGIIGAGRIGTAYARMMMEGHKMDVVYFDVGGPNKFLEEYAWWYNKVLEWAREAPVTVTQVQSVEELLQQSDVVSLHCALVPATKHLINKERLSHMKKDALLINASRGPVVNEKDLVAHLKANPNFRAGLDVFEDEPEMKPGLDECENAVIVPHIASASFWTRAGMATLAAGNVAAVIKNKPVWNKESVIPFVDGPLDTEPYQNSAPAFAPSIVNAKDLPGDKFPSFQ